MSAEIGLSRGLKPAYPQSARLTLVLVLRRHFVLNRNGSGATTAAAPREAAGAAGPIWLARIGFGRLQGYALKYGNIFQHTHLGMVGKSGPRPALTAIRRADRPGCGGPDTEGTGPGPA